MVNLGLKLVELAFEWLLLKLPKTSKLWVGKKGGIVRFCHMSKAYYPKLIITINLV